MRPIASTSTPAAWARGEEGEQAIVGDGGDVDALILGEIAGMAERRRAVDQRADIAGQRHFGERDGEAAVGDVVAGGDRAAGDRGADELAGARARRAGRRRRRAGSVLAAVDFAQPERLAEMAVAVADRDDDVARRP